MLVTRKSQDRGQGNLDWLTSFYTFSFAEYEDPDHMGFRKLRVINEDIVIPGAGFDTHHHHNMEIITYVVEGSLEHKDSLGNGGTIVPGEIQRMTAGSGIKHSEFNHSKSNTVHLLQIWIFPDSLGLEPSYEQKTIDKKLNELILIGSKVGQGNAVTINQDVKLYVAYLTDNQIINYNIAAGRHVWIQLILGHLDVNGIRLDAGDGMAISDEKAIKIQCIKNAEFLLFDLA